MINRIHSPSFTRGAFSSIGGYISLHQVLAPHTPKLYVFNIAGHGINTYAFVWQANRIQLSRWVWGVCVRFLPDAEVPNYCGRIIHLRNLISQYCRMMEGNGMCLDSDRPHCVTYPTARRYPQSLSESSKFWLRCGGVTRRRVIFLYSKIFS